MAQVQETQHQEQYEEEEEDTTATAFSFDIPMGAETGTIMKVPAPDGVQLRIPLPKGVYPGDSMHMVKSDNGKWGIKHVVRNELPKISLEPTGKVVRKTGDQIAKDLTDANVCTVCLKTTKGPIKLKIVPSWAPLGAQRFMQLVTDGFYSDIAVYRAVPDFLVQFGVIGENEDRQAKEYQAIKDDYLRGVPVQEGSVCFAAAGPNTRTSTICIFLADFDQLGGNPWETPIGKVCQESMSVLRSIHTGYGDMPQCGGKGPDPIQLQEKGNQYIRDKYPLCDFVSSVEWLS
jgi:cyclophilin family peptidyl-prolyl cis-trans isomerase